MNAGQFRAALDRAGLTQRTLAERLGVAENTVSRWALGQLPVPRYAGAFLDALLGYHSISDYYRGERIVSYSFLTQACHYCGDSAMVRVVRSNPNPLPGRVPGEIVTYYCADHAPDELRAAVSSWIDILTTWPRPDDRQRHDAQKQPNSRPGEDCGD